MSVWRGRELPLEPIAGALSQLSTLVGNSVAACNTSPFAECLHELQALHDQQVSVLSEEVSRLRKEVEMLREDAKSGDSVKEVAFPVAPQSPLMVSQCDYLDAPRPSIRASQRSALRRHAHQSRGESLASCKLGDAAEYEDTRSISKATWVRSARLRESPSHSPSKDSEGRRSLSEGMCRSVAHQLEQLKRDGSISPPSPPWVRSSVRESQFASPRPVRTARETETAVRISTKDTSVESSVRGSVRLSTKDSKDTSVKSLSEEVSKNVNQQLEQYSRNSERPVSHLRTGSMLLNDYATYTKSTGCERVGFAKMLVSNPKFDVFMGTIIVMNAVTIGLEASLNRAGHEVPLALQISEYIFLFCYTLEVSLRISALRCRALCNGWVQFDALLVCLGFLDLATTYFGTTVNILDNVMLVRTFRLARLARVLRLMVKFHTLWMLVQGLLNSLMTLTWTVIVICILLFVFAVLGLELLQPDPSAGKEYNRVAEENFGSLLKTTVTLLHGLTLDNFALVYRPVMLEKPFTLFYFVPFMLVVSITLMNLVTALMVNFSLEQATKDRQAEEQQQLKQKEEVVRILEAAFGELDADSSGELELEEMLAAPKELRTLICQVANMEEDNDEELTNIFRTLDFENSGLLKIEDFCQGLLMLHDHKALESYYVMKNLAGVMKTMRPRRSERSDRPGRNSSGMVSVDFGDLP